MHCVDSFWFSNRLITCCSKMVIIEKKNEKKNDENERRKGEAIAIDEEKAGEREGRKRRIESFAVANR